MNSLMLKFIVAMCLLVLNLPNAYAHQSSDSFLTLNIADQDVSGQLAVSVRDLDLLAGLDLNQDGLVTWGEIRTQEQVLQSLILTNVSITAQHAQCKISLSPILTDHYNDGAYLLFPLQTRCDAAIGNTITVSYHLLFDIDAQHRGLLKLTNGANSLSAVFRPEERQRAFTIDAGADAILDNYSDPGQKTSGGINVNLWQFSTQLWDFILYGIWHIWIGIDHILFLLTLLLPAVLVWHQGRWQGVPHWRDASRDTVKIVTAFTVAHSITLCLATTGLIVFPTQWVEVAIAASVIITAANNVYPFLKISRWLLTFVFGLIHGLGFAAVLSELSLGTTGLFTSLLGFNIGVEIGQLVIVAIWFPIAYWLRTTFVYRQLIYKLGSSVIVIIASFWLYQRIAIY